MSSEGAVDGGLVDEAHFDHELPKRAALFLLQLKGFGDLGTGNLAHLDQDSPERTTLKL